MEIVERLPRQYAVSNDVISSVFVFIVFKSTLKGTSESETFIVPVLLLVAIIVFNCFIAPSLSSPFPTVPSS